MDLKDAEDLRGAVQMAVGAASVCWESPEGAGVFNDAKALEVADALLAWLEPSHAAWGRVVEAVTGNPAYDGDGSPDSIATFLEQTTVTPIELIDFTFDGPPGPEGPRFIDTHDQAGRGIGIGEWFHDLAIPPRESTWSLRVPVPKAAIRRG